MSFSSLTLGRTPFGAARYNKRLQLKILLLLIIILGGLFIALGLQKPPVVDANPTAIITIKQGSASPTTTRPAPQVSKTVVQAAKPVVATQPSTCTPDTSYQMPTQLSLSQPGLQQVIDSPNTYTVYGNSGSQILAQMAQCTPVHYTSGIPAILAASTAYSIDWQFDYVYNGTNCSLSNVKVGLHINQIFPNWQPSGGNNSMAASWQGYISKLHAYENGHVQLDEQAGATVLDDLQNFPPTDCTAITQAATTQAEADLHSYDIANANYDTGNNYGLNQGITL